VHGAVFDQLPAGEQRFLAQLDRAHREATRIGRVNAALTAMRGAAALAERTFGEAAQDALLAGGAAENLRLTHPAGPEESDLAARLAEISTAYARGETADAARLTVAGIQVAVEPGLSPGILTLTPVVAGLPRDHFADSDPGPAAVLGLRVSADEPDLVQRVNAHFQLLIGNVSGLRTQEWEAEGQMRQTRDDAQQLLDHRAFQLPQSDIGSRAEAVFDQACADLKALLAEPAGRRPADTASVSTRAVMEFDRQAATSLQAYLAKPNVPGHYASMVADSLKLIKALTAVAPAVSPPTARRTVRPAQPPALLEAPSGPTPPQAAL